MDLNRQARRETTRSLFGETGNFAALCEFFTFFAVNLSAATAKFAKEDAKLRRGMAEHLPSCLILAGLLLASSGLQAFAQQPAKPVAKPVTRPLAVNTPPKTASSSAPSSNDPQQLLASGQAAQDQGRFEEAIQTYNRVIALSANQSRIAAIANFRIGNAYMAQGKFGNAEVAFERAVALNPNDAESHNNLGEALGELKQYPRALEAFNRAISLDQKLLKAKYNQAVSYDRMGNFRYSEFVFRSLIKTNPGYSLSYDGLAVTLSKAGRAKEAIAFHEQAIALDPREPSYYFNCAISYLMLGNNAKALEQQEKLKAIDPAIANRLASVIVKHQM
jgi:Flp pilus assembly protein TadD